MPQTTPHLFHTISTSCAIVITSFTVLILLSSCQSSPEQAICTDILGCISIAPDDQIRTGLLQSLSSKMAPLGLAQVRGFELALDKREQGIDGLESNIVHSWTQNEYYSRKDA